MSNSIIDNYLDGQINRIATLETALSQILTLSGLTLEDLARQDDFRYEDYIERLRKIHKLAKGAGK